MMYGNSYNNSMIMLLSHTMDNKYTPINEELFNKLKEKTQKALIKYAESVNFTYKKYESKPKNDIFYLVRKGYIILETKDFDLGMDATGEHSSIGILKGENFSCGQV